LLAFGTVQERPWIPGIVLFLVASLLVLLLLGRLTSRSAMMVRLERNRSLLPILSGLLTLIIPLGQILMVGQLSLRVLAAWFVFLTYCSSGVVYTQGLVRSVLKERPPTWTSLGVSAVIIGAEVVALNALKWLSIAALTIDLPLIIHRLMVQSTIGNASSKLQRIRRVGFAQAGNLVTVVIILALSLRL
jgi:hypothetical protein